MGKTGVLTWAVKQKNVGDLKVVVCKILATKKEEKAPTTSGFQVKLPFVVFVNHTRLLHKGFQLDHNCNYSNS